MSSLMDTLLTNVQTECETNGTLSYITHTYVIQAMNEEYIPNISTTNPFALIYPISSTYAPSCIGNRSNQALYLIGISVIQEYWGADIGIIGDTNHKGAAEIEDDLYQVFDRNRLSNTAMGAVFLNASYVPIGFSKLRGLSQVHCQIQYLDEDYY